MATIKPGWEPLPLPNDETVTFLVGAEEANTYRAHRYDRAGTKPCLDRHDVYGGQITD